MPNWLEFPYLALTSRFDGQLFHSQALHFPDLVRLASKPPLPPLVKSLQKFYQELPALRLHRQFPPGAWTVETHPLVVAPAKIGVAWRDTFSIQLQALHYQPAAGQLAAYLPALQIEVHAADRTALELAIPTQARAELMRRGALRDLGLLVELSRWGELTAEPGVLHVQRKTTREALTWEAPATDWLSKLATALIDLPPSAAHYQEHLERLAELLGGLGPGAPPEVASPERGRSVLLVGPSGVGKTAAFHELVRRKKDYHLGSTPFFESSGARLIGGEQGFGGWQQRCLALINEWSSRRAVVHVGPLVELLEVGRHSSSPTGMAGFFRPALARGQIQAVAECTDQQLTYLEREFPQILEVFALYRMASPGTETTRAILGSRFKGLSQEERELALGLRERFACHTSSPGWEVRLLQSVVRTGQTEEGEARTISCFSQQSGIPSRFLDPAQLLPAADVSRWFSSRLHGQPEAVERVVDRLLAFKAALNRPGRPLASLLLMGPTGVGKTELARCLAEYIFQDRRRLTRLDMSEYSDPLAVRRLVGWAGTNEPGLLIQMVRELPFQVVLFDELEKAHPDFFDLLLQVLGEGRLSDARGNLADFSNCLILMTTNLGAEAMQKGSVGFRDQPPQSGYLEAVRAAFRPELLNRIDEVIPFSRLSREVVEELARQELERIQKAPGLRRRTLHWHVTAQVVPALAEQGYDPRYGARPLKRAVEKLLLAPLAAQLNNFEEDSPLQILVGAIDGVVEGYVRPLHDPLIATNEAQRKRSLGDKISLLRRRSSRLDRGPLMSEMRNDQVRHQRKHPKQPWPEASRMEGILTVVGAIQELEELAIFGLEQIQPFDEEKLRSQCTELLGQLNQKLVGLYHRSFAGRNACTLGFYSDHQESLHQLADAYIRFGRTRNYKVELQSLRIQKGEIPVATPDHPQPHLDRQKQELEWWLQGFPGSSLLGILVRFQSPEAYGTLHLESGVHLLKPNGLVEKRVYLEISEAPLVGPKLEAPYKIPAYQPPEELHRKGSLAQLLKTSLCRSYDLASGKCQDSLLERPRNCLSGTELDLSGMIEARLLRVAEEAGLAE